jgi:hypothetical protein
MTYAELLEEVYTLTKRADRTAETASAVKAATLKAHQSDFYSKDLYETGINLGELAYRHSYDYIALFDNFRTFKYFKRVEDQNDDVGKFLDIITVDEVLDSYGNNRTDIAYVAGRVLEIRSSVEFQYALIGFYANPIVRTGAYSSWVAQMYPYAIVYEAARTVLTALGQQEEANGMAALVREQYQILRASSLTDVGY